jgi:hypothetical protein
MGVHEAPEEFCRRSLSEGWIPKIGRLTGVLERSPGVTWVRTRVVSHVQYDLRGLGMHLHGEEAAENAYHGEVLGDSRWLRAVTPPFNPFADRRTCSEFRFFDRIIEALSRAGLASDDEVRSKVEGYITIHINCAPCVSCIGVVRQFQLLFKGVDLQMSGGRGIHVEAFSEPDAAEGSEASEDKIHQELGEDISVPVSSTENDVNSSAHQTAAYEWELAVEDDTWQWWWSWNYAWGAQYGQTAWWQSSRDSWQHRW